MTTVRLVAFDLDDTLAPSKAPLDPRMAELLVRLLDEVEVCVISGGQFGQFQTQLIANLPATDAAGAADPLARLHLMPTCGTQYYRHTDGDWHQVYAENLDDDQKTRAQEAVVTAAKRLGLWTEDTWGPALEDRGSQITYSALGQQAPIDAKAAWDPDGSKKEALRAAVAPELPDLEVRSGGSTSVDITRQGIDKAYGMNRLADLTGIPLDAMFFVGDRLDEGGNDYPVKALGIPTHAVHGWPDTATWIEGFLTDRAK